MIRRMIKIDENKCNGCGLCAAACHEGAIVVENGKARLISDAYCDGLGDCLPACPVDAIGFEEREAAPYDAAAVKIRQRASRRHSSGGCPGGRERAIERTAAERPDLAAPSELTQWPVQLKLLPANAACLDGAQLLIAADCTAFAYGDFHRRFIKGRVVLIGCPKLDEGDYTAKLTAILRENDIQGVTVVRMEAPCCGGITAAARAAAQACGKAIPWREAVISVDGGIVEEG